MKLTRTRRRQSLPVSFPNISCRRMTTAAAILAMFSAAFLGTVLADAQKPGEWNKEAKHPADKPFVMKKEFAVAPGGLLTIDADRGAIEIRTTDRNSVTVEVTRTIAGKHLADADEILKHHEIQIIPDGPNLSVRARMKPVKADSIRLDGVNFDISEDVHRAMKQALNRRLRHMQFRLLIPKRYNVNAKTGGGGISIADLSGTVRCQTSGGSLQLGRIDGEVLAKTSGGCIRLAKCNQRAELRTSGGSISTGDIHGDAIAHTSGGSINLGDVDGTVSAKTAGGSIHLANVGGTVEATTAGGSVSATITKQPRNDCLFRTSGGSVSIRLARTLALNIEASGAHGRVSGPFIEHAKGKRKSRVHRVALNGGGPKLTAKTASGNVRFEYTGDQNTTRKMLSKQASK